MLYLMRLACFVERSQLQTISSVCQTGLAVNLDAIKGAVFKQRPFPNRCSFACDQAWRRFSASNGELMSLSKSEIAFAPFHGIEAQSEPQRPHAELAVLKELIEVLVLHPDGLRRWSVMRTIRNKRIRASQSISLKFETEIERVFRNSCRGWGDLKGLDSESIPFYRPEGKAGEVWAMYTRHAKAWLEKTGAAGNSDE